MERECFEDPQIAALMNERFVCIKVDREERPDVDAIYMDAVQAMTGHGGWPLNAFLTPAGVPFYAGTYFPPEPRQGMPSWPQVLEGVAEAWRDQRPEIDETGRRILPRLAGAAALPPAEGEPDPAALDAAVTILQRGYDQQHGGFTTGAPKFPPASVIEFLLARGERRMALHTLRAMASGGMYDQIGGGFARYSVDARWEIPHFEKMLYDNALLARAYLHGFQVSGEPFFERVCCETLDWALRDLRQAEGGFASALDADSEGVEGRFYVWTPDELRAALGDADADAAIAYFGLDRPANFEGRWAPVRAASDPDGLAAIKARLLEVREARVWPALDDKRLTAWNALMISALADAGGALDRSDYVDAAVACAEFVWGSMRDGEGRLLRTYNRGEARLAAYLEDHAFLLEAFADALRRDVRPALVRRGARARGHDHRPLLRRGQRRLLRDRGRPRGADRAAQGPRGQPDPVRRLGRRVRPAAARGADRRARLRGGGARGDPVAARRRAGAPACVRASAAGDGLPLRRGEGGRDRRSGRGAARAGRARRLPPARRPRRRAGGGRAAARGPRAGRRPRRRVRLRALHLPASGDRAGRARRAALTLAGRSIAFARRFGEGCGR